MVIVNALRQLPTLAAACCLTLAVAGCGSLPDHLFYSGDRHVFYSTVQLPTNVAVVEPYSGDVLWSMEVPVEHKLIVNFERSGELEPVSVSTQPSTAMKWKLFGANAESGTVELPGTAVAMRISYRPRPEYPEGKVPESMRQEIAPITPAPAATPENASAAEPVDEAPASDDVPADAVSEDPMSETPASEDAAPATSNGGEPIENIDPADAAGDEMTK